jgi:hypothetical protein
MQMRNPFHCGGEIRQQHDVSIRIAQQIIPGKPFGLSNKSLTSDSRKPLRATGDMPRRIRGHLRPHRPQKIIRVDAQKSPALMALRWITSMCPQGFEGEMVNIASE